ncbi:MAG: RNA polymerase sigma factor SigE [Lawsonella sp.]|nr:RNA polymerase sigma factor SigE [Mycobacteriales bacterium]
MINPLRKRSKDQSSAQSSDAKINDEPDLSSWDAIVRDYSDSVYRLAYRLTGNPQDAEDLTQETFIRVFRSLDRFKPGSFKAWINRITTNIFLDNVRRANLIRMEALPEDTDRVPSDSPAPAALYDAQLLHPELQKALDNLSPEYRVAVVLRDIEGLTYEEISDVLNVKVGTVRSRIHRGRQQIRAALNDRPPVFAE